MFLYPEKPSHWQGEWSIQTGSFSGESNNWFAVGRTERDLYKWSLPPPCKPQLEMGVSIWYRPGLGAGTQGLEDRPRERTAIGCAETAKRGWRVQATTRGVHRRNPEPLRKQRTIIKRCVKGGEGLPLQPLFSSTSPCHNVDPPRTCLSHHCGGHSCLCGLSHPSCHLSQLWEQMPMGCPLTEVGLKPQVSPRSHMTWKAGLKSLPEGCKFTLPIPALQIQHPSGQWGLPQGMCMGAGLGQSLNCLKSSHSGSRCSTTTVPGHDFSGSMLVDL